MDCEIIQMDTDTWQINDGEVRFFLLEGSQKALLIDTGMTTKNAREIAESLTGLPLMLLNTHADGDHTAGNDAFDTALMHPSEYINYIKKDTSHPVPTPVHDGDIIDLGDRSLQIILQPGHTPGSIAVLDITRRELYSADSIQNGSIFLFGPMRNLYAYRQSLDRIWEFRNRFDKIYPSHGDLPLDPEVIPALMRDMDSILAGSETLEPDVVFGMPVHVCHMDSATFILD